ncbi:ABC transporter permease [Candidatus Saccharibacteria bacterium]|uniref:Macrolide export ATP-binding/permease protein MacB n=1 Tax=Candidatus Nanosyncoccus alces TaxID=2171997 RepID=A0ABY0FP40_9BACT|nr:ABC transporter permease [Candidatus Nanosyncoccus alces]MBQ2643839.1 ABC transporter permease [Candidatus Saccharibacteria bacterium]MBQ3441473.1 ABC transporter permease [Candidatus Saccharibacteria bacterium]RYC74973.1 Macrolide export ATP-binding/permease protein MacB [Candidatus Nanosyncoccus alces]
MALLLKTHFKLAKTSIKENRTRSFLTCLGIAIGVASIILILSLMGSISNLIKSEVSEIGSDLIVVRPSSAKNSLTNIIEELTSANTFQQSSLSLSDVSTISEIENISAVAPIALSTNTIDSEKNNFSSVPILGTTPDFEKIEPLALRYGTFFTDNNKTNGVVLGHTLSLALFNTINSTVGKTITIMGEKFMVVGVLDQIDKSINFDNVDFDNALIMDIGTLDKLIGSTQIQQINIKATNTDSLAAISDNIQTTLKNSKSGDENFTVTYGDDITHPSSSLFVIVSGMLAIVAAISLVVGGIGVMNIMLVSVAERTHEIGIRKAVGASSRNILMQFLFEALILSVLGGIFGLILGYILAFLLSIITPFAPFISWEILAITFLTTLIVGIIFGIYPALKAASKDPIESLKHYR